MDTNKVQISTAKKLHGILSDLWPMLSMKNVGIVIDSADWRPDSVAFYLDQTSKTEGYIESLTPGHPALQLFEPYPPQHLLVIDTAKAMAEGGWRELLLTGLHEFAHAIRSELAEGLYPDFHTLKKVGDYLEERLGESMGTDEEPPTTLLVTDDLMNDVDRHLFPADGSGMKPLFGSWVVRTFQHDGGHDLLFYLVLYMLEREATDRGYFEDGVEVVRSVYMPERVDACLGGAAT